jgi:hypothetical protein
MNIELTFHDFRPGALVTSEESTKLSNQFWKEMLDELRRQNPNIDVFLGQ